VLVLVFTAQRADRLFASAKEIAITTGSYNQFQSALDKALQLEPYHPDYNLFKTNVMIQLYGQTQNEQFAQEANAAIERMKKKEPYNRGLVELEYSLYLKKGQLDAALGVMENAIENFPWDITLYEKDIELKAELGALNSKYWDSAFELSGEIESKAHFIESLPSYERAISKNFTINNKIAASLGKIYFMRGQFSEAATLLQKHLVRDLKPEENRIVMRYYLASLIMQGKNDKSNSEMLFAADPNEERYVLDLVNSAK
jgi:tetratricopeptide (TPR) repeat protein